MEPYIENKDKAANNVWQVKPIMLNLGTRGVFLEIVRQSGTRVQVVVSFQRVEISWKTSPGKVCGTLDCCSLHLTMADISACFV